MPHIGIQDHRAAIGTHPQNFGRQPPGWGTKGPQKIFNRTSVGDDFPQGLPQLTLREQSTGAPQRLPLKAAALLLLCNFPRTEASGGSYTAMTRPGPDSTAMGPGKVLRAAGALAVGGGLIGLGTYIASKSSADGGEGSATQSSTDAAHNGRSSELAELDERIKTMNGYFQHEKSQSVLGDAEDLLKMIDKTSIIDSDVWRLSENNSIEEKQADLRFEEISEIVKKLDDEVSRVENRLEDTEEISRVEDGLESTSETGRVKRDTPIDQMTPQQASRRATELAAQRTAIAAQIRSVKIQLGSDDTSIVASIDVQRKMYLQNRLALLRQRDRTLEAMIIRLNKIELDFAGK